MELPEKLECRRKDIRSLIISREQTKRALIGWPLATWKAIKFIVKQNFIVCISASVLLLRE